MCLTLVDHGAGPWDYGVWHSLHVRPRRFGPQKIPGGSHCQRAVFEKSGCSTPGITYTSRTLDY